MKKNIFLIMVLSVLSFTLYLTSCTGGNPKSAEDNTKVSTPEKATMPTNEDIVNRGKYLVTIMGCNDCHSPKKNGPNGPEVIPELMLSGFPADAPIVKMDSKLIKKGFAMLYPDMTAAAGPWGVSFAGNLTPDQTGIGNWTAEQFKKALTQGIFKGLDGGRILLPPMPWFDFAVLTDEDVNAIFTYLKSIKPVKNTVPPPIAPDKM